MAESTAFVLQVVLFIFGVTLLSLYVGYFFHEWWDDRWERRERRDFRRRQRAAFRTGRLLGFSDRQIVALLRKLEDKGVRTAR